MSIQNDYDSIIGDLVERAELIIKDEGYDRESAIEQAIDDGLIYGEDEATILAWALMSGVVEWGANVDWSMVWDMIREDIDYELRRGEDMKK